MAKLRQHRTNEFRGPYTRRSDAQAPYRRKPPPEAIDRLGNERRAPRPRRPKPPPLVLGPARPSWLWVQQPRGDGSGEMAWFPYQSTHALLDAIRPERMAVWQRPRLEWQLKEGRRWIATLTYSTPVGPVVHWIGVAANRAQDFMYDLL